MPPLLFGAFAALAVGLLTLGSLLAAGAAFVFVSAVCWLFQPVMAANFADPWLLTAAALAIGGFVALFRAKGGSRRAQAALLTVAMAGSSVLLLIGVGFFTTCSIFRADAYASLLGRVETVSFEKAIQRLDTAGHVTASDRTVIDQDSVRLVDRGVATRKAQELIGKDPEFGGAYVHGTMQLTARNGRLVWAAPLEFNGFFQWLHSDGSPAYVWVDAHDERLADLVKRVGGRPLRMRCLPSAFFGDNTDRLVWNRMPQVATTDYSFELGPDGRPYYVVTAYNHLVGFGGSDATGIIIVDPQTCTTEWRGLDPLPAWVNRVVPAEFAMEQAADWATLGGGWLNASWFGAHTDITVPSSNAELVRTTATGDTAWYVGLSTPGNMNGTTGFLLIDSRSKKAAYFTQAGATEEAARVAIEGKIAQMRGWTVTQPLLYNVEQTATYLAILKDAGGNFKGVGILPVEDRNLVVTADDLPGALKMYAQALAKRRLRAGAAAPSEPNFALDATVLRKASEVLDGNTVYWFAFEGNSGEVFSATNGIGPQVALTQPGDTVHLTAHGHDGVFTVDSLVNPSVRPAADGK
jgi:hypothetical protein